MIFRPKQAAIAAQWLIEFDLQFKGALLAALTPQPITRKGALSLSLFHDLETCNYPFCKKKRYSHNNSVANERDLQSLKN